MGCSAGGPSGSVDSLSIMLAQYLRARNTGTSMGKVAKASINFKPVSQGSESHNNRTQANPPRHIYAELAGDNSRDIDSTLPALRKEIKAHCKLTSGKKMRSDATPIREAVLTITPDTTVADIHKTCTALHARFKITARQIHIHRDEGHLLDDEDPEECAAVMPVDGRFVQEVIKDGQKRRLRINHHAHVVFDWQNKETGKVLRLNRADMRLVQTIVARSLGMTRGKKGSTVKRLGTLAYKEKKIRARIGRELTRGDEAKQALIAEGVAEKKVIIREAQDTGREVMAEVEEWKADEEAASAAAVERAQDKVEGLEDQAEGLQEEVEQLTGKKQALALGQQQTAKRLLTWSERKPKLLRDTTQLYGRTKQLDEGTKQLKQTTSWRSRVWQTLERTLRRVLRIRESALGMLRGPVRGADGSGLELEQDSGLGR